MPHIDKGNASDPDIPASVLSQDLIASVKGFLDPEEGRALYRWALEASRLGPCLEIGSYCGKSSLYLGCACRARGTILFSVDHHRGSEEHQPGELYFDAALFDYADFAVNTLPRFRDTLRRAGLEENVVPIVAASQVAARGWATPLALIFIDGGHALETVLTDYRVWSPHLLPGGYLLIHDLFEDPAQGGQAPFRAYQAALASGNFNEAARVKSLGVLRQLSKNGS
jgi:predicted O-methyltransferase YrrM